MEMHIPAHCSRCGAHERLVDALAVIAENCELDPNWRDKIVSRIARLALSAARDDE